MKTVYKDGKPVVLNGQVLQVDAGGGISLNFSASVSYVKVEVYGYV